jgi:hypothetical protein
VAALSPVFANVAVVGVPTVLNVPLAVILRRTV